MEEGLSCFVVANDGTYCRDQKNGLSRASHPASGLRKSELGENNEVFVIKRKGYLKVVPKRQVDLTEWFDQADLGVESIGNWASFEKRVFRA
jgi:hypothetical protein